MADPDLAGLPASLEKIQPGWGGGGAEQVAELFFVVVLS